MGCRSNVALMMLSSFRDSGRSAARHSRYSELALQRSTIPFATDGCRFIRRLQKAQQLRRRDLSPHALARRAIQTHREPR